MVKPLLRLLPSREMSIVLSSKSGAVEPPSSSLEMRFQMGRLSLRFSTEHLLKLDAQAMTLLG